MAVPLRKKREDGTLYQRRAAVEAQIDQIALLPDSELLLRIKIRAEDDPGYVKSESLIYLLRQTRNDGNTSKVAELFTELRKRVIRSARIRTQTVGGSGKKGRSAFDEDWIDAIVERFCQLLCSDRNSGYDERLDYYECSFNSALLALRTDQKRKVISARKHLKLANEEIESEVVCSNSAESLQKWREQISDLSKDFLYRSKLAHAINSLPDKEKHAIELVLRVDGSAEESSLAAHGKLLGCNEQTVRNRRNRAIARLRAALEEGDSSD